MNPPRWDCGIFTLARPSDCQPDGSLRWRWGSRQGREDLEVFGSSGGFFGTDDVAEVGDRAIDTVDPIV
jgi:hypothetical protein